MKKLSLWISLSIFSVLVVSTYGQITIPLQLDASDSSFISRPLFCDASKTCGLAADEESRVEKWLSIGVRRDGTDFLISTDLISGGGAKGERKIRLKSGEKVIVELRRQISPQRFLDLPYQVSHQRLEENEKVVDSFNIRAHFLMKGTFRSPGCSVNLALNDINADSNIDLRDGESGSNLQIDRNNDGKFRGREEFSRTNEIIEICGQNYLVTALDYSQLVLEPTTLKLAKIGERVVNFSFELINGRRVSNESMQGRPYIMGFWASWCAICVAELPYLSKLRSEFNEAAEFFAINVDSASESTRAERIIQQNQLGDFSSIRGRGDDDPMWKVFGGVNSNRLAVPLYVLIDDRGIVRYASNGGKQLVDLKKTVNDTLGAVTK